ncbi:alpha-(1,3)-fucosyltransferase C-like isoform X2 [Mizuhopecten yessoensis]|uniref:alpha-(1,3)-fucosyltransferase C-like isoform X1 n=1 Tax=Mizuhopecten yessoensis TaxID=6573 RepID=UPI000B45CA74|nr:alpha-(1,3)-fucosyltransferase C-like isoform X1 [Mizuhopecten yessoensis]XP_021359691.1 alpha-(1,3)-fucosyltransferase C-like isoform X2 [Mizuhopecten yessoensis]
MASKSSSSRFQLMTMLISLFLMMGIALYTVLYQGTSMLNLKPHIRAIGSMFIAPPPPKPKPVIQVTYYNRPAWISQHVFDTCKDRCEMISSSRYKNSDVVVFHAPTLYLGTPLKKYRGQTWVFHDMEPPSLVPNFKRWKRLFNWTLSYRRDADIFNPYSTFTRRTDAEKNDIHKIDWNNKTRNIGWIVSHCGVASQRLKYGEKLKQTIDVDAFGRCGKLHCPRGQWQECLGKYKFYASFENSLCTDYITEKSFRVFERNVDSIPVTRGAPDYSMFLPPGSFVNTRNFSSTSNLGNFLKRLSDDKPTVMKYFKWRRYYKANDQIDSKMGFCELCRRLHNPSLKYKRLYEHIDEWVRQEALPRRSCIPVADLI